MQFKLNCPSRVLQIAAAIFALVVFETAQADIFQWEYINPADPSQGKRQSTTLALDGAGVSAVPEADLSYRNLTMAYLIGADVRNASFRGGMLTDADFTNADLRGTNFNASYCSGSMGCFRLGTGLSPVQLYATASYQCRDLSGINFDYNDLAGGNFVGQNLTNASFEAAALTDADFTNAEVRDADFGSAITLVQLYSTASYEAGDLSGIELRRNDLAGGNFADQNVTNANFAGATLTGADFTGAKLQNANFARPLQFGGEGGPFLVGTGITLTQLYSTASYQARDLSGINVIGSDLAGGNFIGQNLTNSVLGGIAGVDLTAADARGAVLYAGVMATNLILPDGQIDGLDLETDGLLVLRDYDGNPIAFSAPAGPIPISVAQHFTMGAGGVLRIVFEADAWDSTISFAPGIPVALGGTLELTFAAEVNLSSQIGRTFDLFDWTGVNPTGAFAVSSPYAWDLSNLYTTGEVTLTAAPEPSGLFLLCCMLAAILAIQRRATLLPRCGLRVAASSLAVVVLASTSQADIFQWEYIDPTDPSRGRRQSTTLAPDGAGVDAGPRANLAGRDLTMAYLQGTRFSLLIPFDYLDLCCANKRFYAANLTATNLTRADLTNANFGAATLTDADFTGADISGASFGKPIGYLNNTNLWRPLGNGISIEQIYATASYQAHDLSTIDFSHNNFSGANFAGQNLAHANFYGTNVAGADFTGAEIRGSYFGKFVTYDPPNTVPNQPFTSGSGISLEQIYATASYRAQDLSGVGFSFNYLDAANFAGQNLTNTSFDSVPLRNANLTAADARGAFGLGIPVGAGTTNLIWSDGHIDGLDLNGVDQLAVRDYDGDSRHDPAQPPIPITVDQHLAIGPGGTLRMVFEADAWDSTISFAPGIPVALGGTLELTFAPDVNLASQVGRTFDLFDWTGVNPTGAFVVASQYAWDLSNLYTTGQVTLTAVPEPSSVALATATLGAFVLRYRRRPHKL